MNEGSTSIALSFIDSNIWLYAFIDAQDQQKHLLAKTLIQQTIRIALSTQIINEVSINLLRKFKAAEIDIQALIEAFYRNYVVIELDRSILLQASLLRSAYQFSFWDSVVVASALAAGATTLYSEDMQDGLVILNQLTVVNPLKLASNA